MLIRVTMQRHHQMLIGCRVACRALATPTKSSPRRYAPVLTWWLSGRHRPLDTTAPTDSPCYPKNLERGVRSEGAMMMAAAEMYVQGIRTERSRPSSGDSAGSKSLPPRSAELVLAFQLRSRTASVRSIRLRPNKRTRLRRWRGIRSDGHRFHSWR